ncbi:mitochondrial import inner membrane translocase subunit tim10 [Coccidioides immitis RS]|uniref:Mitochondrial import inner membrane translocase subunit n=6 Tax=Coccidioides TaxID=5500 RepID=A0A0D8JUQ4_COCIM|nr:Tim10/DDP family zinc finger containing protein [Coccidioides posadasii C735 delta SOWgp]XP_012213875.1 mitochondrial import inner membrane translocase subunit tim10 [Coccidioides immitis RS]KMM70439.1 mitochondrial import inner membrane translocase subunit tim10 [Coccidioides posadasii RMSCC 3488]KMU77631.1 mitochondrial import inner membrane translocase subunit tim10 [Coccidioides immitis RMSCC 3703]KMU85557.1 mitochondrial import inner membrane translocase subunit tim10 [Coccidioides immi|eukprot:XP_003071414.1 Tim10/DDP family zinc finger containing protein [Coccidioides posadasii C735 delta SOWgp]
MSFLFGGRPQISSEEKIQRAELEFEMITDMVNRLNAACMKKCIPPDYREGDLNKGESVCLDRCVSKFFEVHMKVSEKMAQMQGQAGAGQPGAGFGM